MHIADGFLPAQVCLAGYAATGGLTWYSFRQITRDRTYRDHIPKTALLSAAFFVASAIHIPIPPTSVHPLLNGLLGAVLGWYAFPAILVGLFFQAIMFQHGGMSVLGVNAIIMGVPALIAGYVFQLRGLARRDNQRWQNSLTNVFAFLAGALGVGISTLLFYLIAITNIPGDLNAAIEMSAIGVLVLAQLPLTLIEGMITAMMVNFFQQVKPELLSLAQTWKQVD